MCFGTVVMPPEQLIPRGVKALIFDCDGTLLDTMPLHWKAWCHICSLTGLKFNKSDFFALAGVPGKHIIRRLADEQGIKLDHLEWYAKKKEFFLHGLSEVSTIPCVVRYVLEANSKGIPCAVASGSTRSQVQKGLKMAGLLDLFDFVLGNEDYTNSKPSPDPFLAAAEKLGVDPSECWGFEDADIGLESIHKAGFAKAIDARLLPGYPHAENKE